MKKNSSLSLKDLALIFVGVLIVIVLFLLQKHSSNLLGETAHFNSIQKGILSYQTDTWFLERDEKALAKFQQRSEILSPAKTSDEIAQKIAQASENERRMLSEKLDELAQENYDSANFFAWVKNGLLVGFSLFSLGFFVKKNKVLRDGLQQASFKIEEAQRKSKKLAMIAKSFEKRWKLTEEKLSSLEEEKVELKKEIDNADSLQKEMKGFIDTQIETNEQLMIAESQLKSLLEKEQESKAIINQTLDRLKDTQGQLVHSEKMASLGQLTAGIAHEINNPINFVFNGIDSLKRNLKDLALILDKYGELDHSLEQNDTIKEIKTLKEEYDFHDLREDLDSLVVDVKEGAVRTIEIVKGLRVFSRLDEEDMKEANINECLDATLVLLKNKTKNLIKVTKAYDLEIPEILCYPGQLNQVFMNIINNAIQAIPETKENAEIHVSTFATEDGISIKLRDNGSGMSDEVKQRIFEPFFTTKPVGVGTGLGMSISYGIIEKHQGQLKVESELGVGTEFIIDLPKDISAQVFSEAS